MLGERDEGRGGCDSLEEFWRGEAAVPGQRGGSGDDDVRPSHADVCEEHGGEDGGEGEGEEEREEEREVVEGEGVQDEEGEAAEAREEAADGAEVEDGGVQGGGDGGL